MVALSAPTCLPSAAASLAAANAPLSTPAPAIGGYSGPLIPELRQNPQTNHLADQVYSVLLREIPALAAPTAPVSASSHATGAGLPSALPPLPPPLHSLAPGCTPPAGPHLSHLLPPHLGGYAAQQAPPPARSAAQAQLDVLQQQLDSLRQAHGSVGVYGQARGQDYGQAHGQIYGQANGEVYGQAQALQSQQVLHRETQVTSSVGLDSLLTLSIKMLSIEPTTSLSLETLPTHLKLNLTT